MSTNSRTWFYTEPEHRPYYIEERVNQNLWANRFGSIYLDCVRAEPPFKMEGKWNGINLNIEWQPNNWFVLRASREDRTLISGFSQVLQMLPVVTYTSEDGLVATEWRRDPAEGVRRLQEVKSHATAYNVKTYKR
jgi:hypothetical protein